MALYGQERSGDFSGSLVANADGIAGQRAVPQFQIQLQDQGGAVAGGVANGQQPQVVFQREGSRLESRDIRQAFLFARDAAFRIRGGGGGWFSPVVQFLEDLPHPGHTLHQNGVYQVDAGSDPHGHHQAGGQSRTGAQHPLGEGPRLHRQLVRQAVQSVLDGLEVRGGGRIHLEFPFQVLLKAFLPLQVIFSHDAPPPFLFPVLQRLPGISSVRGRAAASRPPR